MQLFSILEQSGSPALSHTEAVPSASKLCMLSVFCGSRTFALILWILAFCRSPEFCEEFSTLQFVAGTALVHAASMFASDHLAACLCAAA